MAGGSGRSWRVRSLVDLMRSRALRLATIFRRHQVSAFNVSDGDSGPSRGAGLAEAGEGDVDAEVGVGARWGWLFT